MNDYTPFPTCRSCGSQIIFIRTTAGKAMPCDPDPINFERSGGPETFVTPEGKVERGKRRESGPLQGYISHFATCPFADKHRKRRAEKESCGL